MTKTLSENEVSIWYCFCDDVLAGEARDRYLALLSADELQRYHRFVFDKSRRQFLMGRVLVRSVLSQYASVAPDEWEFAYTGRGKPYIAPEFGLSHLRFNHSHTDQLVACAVATQNEVGIDVECIDREVSEKLAEYCLSAPELARYLLADEQERRDLFFRYWTLKESYAKARGLGLSLPFARVSFSLADAVAPEIALEKDAVEEPRAWQFYQCLITPRHYLAIAVHRDATARSRFGIRHWAPENPPSSGTD